MILLLGYPELGISLDLWIGIEILATIYGIFWPPPVAATIYQSQKCWSHK